MKYADIEKQARKNNALQPISSIFKKDWKKGETITGRLISMTEITSDKFKSTYFSYLFNTDDGNIKTALGAGVDQEVRPFMKVGQIFVIISKGTQDIGKGSNMKVFDVLRVPEEGDSAESEVEPSEDQEEISF